MLSMGKRTRSEQKLVSLAEAREAAVAIVDIQAYQLLDVHRCTRLPYPGIGKSSSRPPLDLHYIATQDVFVLARCFFSGGYPNLVITGPRGHGKSSDLRALACFLYSLYAREPSRRQRLVCIWNLPDSLHDVVSVVRNAILFAYLVFYKEETVEERAQVEAKIQNINSMDKAIDFIKERKEGNNETFHILIDGWEYLDEKDSHDKSSSGARQRQHVQNQLGPLFSEGSNVWMAASAKSAVVHEDYKAGHIYRKERCFNEDQYNTYKSQSILGKLEQLRGSDIAFYTGRVPLLLDVLCDCCLHFGAEAKQTMIHMEQFASKAFTIDEFMACPPPTSEDGIVELLEEDDNWAEVLHLFREHYIIKQVQNSIDKIELKGKCHGLEEMGKKDMTYFVGSNKRYCSDFIARMYIEGFRAKEANLNEVGGPWMPYCKHLVGQTYFVNWAGVGWIIEDLVADVIVHGTVCLGKTLKNITGLKFCDFVRIPSLLISDLLNTRPGNGFYYKPRLYSFPYVDGVIIYVDMTGILHILGLQVTVNADNHWISASLFMNLLNLKNWFSDLDNYVKIEKASSGKGASSSSGKGKRASSGKGKRAGSSSGKDKAEVQFHFVMVGFSKDLCNEISEQDRLGELKELKGGKKCGVVGHKATFMPLRKAMISLDDKNLAVMEEVAYARTLKAPGVLPSLASLMQLRKQEIIEVGEQYGVTLDHKRTKEDLVNELQKHVD